MVQISKIGEVTYTATSERSVRIDETEGRPEQSTPSLERTKFLDSDKLQVCAQRTEREKSEPSVPYIGYFPQDDDAKKNRRAKANALMDAKCLLFLKLFNESKTLCIDELTHHLEQPKDWLKISLLIRADFVEALDSTVRITPEGRQAWDRLTQLRD